MSRSFLVALLTIGPLAAGVCVFLLVVAGLVKLFSKDEQGLARLAIDACLTIAAGAAVIIAIAWLAL